MHAWQGGWNHTKTGTDLSPFGRLRPVALASPHTTVRILVFLPDQQHTGALPQASALNA